MSKKDLETAFDLISTKIDPSEILFNGPCSSAAVLNAEKSLSVQFPESYKIFLQQKGSGGPGYIYGLGRNDQDFSGPLPETTAYHVVWSNLRKRSLYDQPIHRLCIYNLGEGTFYALDLSQMNDKGECPVVVWPVGGYEETSVLEIEAEDFGAFFLNMVKKQLRQNSEEEPEAG